MKKKKGKQKHRKIAVACALAQMMHICAMCVHWNKTKSYLFASAVAQTKEEGTTLYNLNTQTIHANIFNSFKYTASIDQTHETLQIYCQNIGRLLTYIF